MPTPTHSHWRGPEFGHIQRGIIARELDLLPKDVHELDAISLVIAVSVIVEGNERIAEREAPHVGG